MVGGSFSSSLFFRPPFSLSAARRTRRWRSRLRRSRRLVAAPVGGGTSPLPPFLVAAIGLDLIAVGPLPTETSPSSNVV
jgi:hypothetical protein